MRNYSEEDAAREVGGAAFVILKFIWIGIKALFLGVSAVASASSKKNKLIIPEERRFEHTHICAGSGHGKTQLIQTLIVTEDFDAVQKGQRSVLVIDSQGDMIEKFLHYKYLDPDWQTTNGFPNLASRFILIDPADIECPPCLNLLDFGLSRLKDYSPLEREQLVNGAIALYEYMFSALLGAELTNRQGVIFRYLARLLMVVEQPTIFTLMEFMENPENIRPYLPKLDIATQRFMLTQFLSPA